ncbi:MAG: dihydropteroate synthase [Piscirickettsiaceae bacterium]|nr:MAG: dihydropteroate synthase [Piscirickettsiaceae bacterium]
MGVLNVTPDSFSDGGQYSLINTAVDQAEVMINAGAKIIDIGGESTRPGARSVSLNEELDRVLPIIQRLRSSSDVIISIDTSKAEVMRQAVEAGATLINDVYALQQPGSIEMAAKLGVPICLMHMQKNPEVMQQRPNYKNILTEVDAFFNERISACEREGIGIERLILDPGFGFGKTLDHNLMLLTNLSFFKHFSCPILVGLSRKSMLGLISGKEVDQRLYASLSAAVIAALNGASILRVHDVAETIDAISIVKAVQAYKAE